MSHYNDVTFGNFEIDKAKLWMFGVLMEFEEESVIFELLKKWGFSLGTNFSKAGRSIGLLTSGSCESESMYNNIIPGKTPEYSTYLKQN